MSHLKLPFIELARSQNPFFLPNLAAVNYTTHLMDTGTMCIYHFDCYWCHVRSVSPTVIESRMLTMARVLHGLRVLEICGSELAILSFPTLLSSPRSTKHIEIQDQTSHPLERHRKFEGKAGEQNKKEGQRRCKLKWTPCASIHGAESVVRGWESRYLGKEQCPEQSDTFPCLCCQGMWLQLNLKLSLISQHR